MDKGDGAGSMAKEDAPAKCPACLWGKTSFLKENDAGLGIWECPSCGHVWVWPQPGDEWLKKFYDTSPHIVDAANTWGMEPPGLVHSVVISHFIEKGKGMKILDVGAAGLATF